MFNTITYLNTDLCLESKNDLAALVHAFRAGDVPPMYDTVVGDNGTSYATFETTESYREPEPNIAAMLAVVESLEPPVRLIWDGCTRREFDMGYDCGAEPWAFNQRLSVDLLGRMATAGATLRLTLYPNRD